MTARLATKPRATSRLGKAASAAVMGLLVTTLAACTSSGKSTSSTNSSGTASAPGSASAPGTASASATPGQSSQAPASATPSQPAKATASATLGLSVALATFDPNIAGTDDQLAITHLIGGNLTQVSAYVGPENQPALAEKIDISSDQLTHTFTLRPNLKFSDGTPLTASDVKATFDYLMGDKSSFVAGYVAPIASTEATSPTVFTIHLKTPDPALEDIISEPNFAILPATALSGNKAALFKKLVSDGPYMMTDVASDGTSATLVANPNYWGPKPAVAKLELKAVTDASTRLSQVQSGQLDFAFSIAPSDVRAVQKPAFANFIPLFGQLASTINTNDPVLKDARIRNALSLATDRTALRDIVWGPTAVNVKPLSGFFPSNDPGYNANDPIKQDIAGAKALLKGTACENGCTLHYLYSTGQPTNEPLAVVLKQQWKAIGVNLVLEPGDRATVNKKVSDGNFQIAKGSVYDYIANPAGLAVIMLQSDGGPFADFSRYNSPQMDDLVKTFLKTPVDQQGPVLAQIDELYQKDRPFLIFTDYANVTVQRIPASTLKMSSAGYIDVAPSS